ncbi:MAG: hypothetical protein SGJ18_14400 [Pseudomonadota bacterium]|nr:hypothetical protein [Pseudomonadota bacterium]
MSSKRILKSEEGMATIEAIPLLIIFVMFVAYGVGAFGIIHTGILHSIAARTYAFETFRHRTNLVYFRDQSSATGPRGEYYLGGTRIHGIQSEVADDSGEYILASERSISKGPMELNVENREEGFHSSMSSSTGPQRIGRGVHPAWIRVQYGICLNTQCGGD